MCIAELGPASLATTAYKARSGRLCELHVTRMPGYEPTITPDATHVVLVDGGAGGLAVRETDLYRDAGIPGELAEEIGGGLDCRCCHRRGWRWAAGGGRDGGDVERSGHDERGTDGL